MPLGFGLIDVILFTLALVFLAGALVMVYDDDDDY